ncbi:PadR family transcriptional regulator [mine drainage metagenome]|uniref:PadR family transcriptional regulator n=1 Tax=mine drainage metagenome TaxID=410659 RepID=T0ZMT2_9ZZZZ
MLSMHKKRGLRNWVLMILRRTPRNGAEIMDDMEVMTQGWWRPSPGSVYPLLEEMLHEGSIQKREDGRYTLVQPVDRNWSWPVPAGRRTAKDTLREIAALTAYLEDLAGEDPATLHNLAPDVDSVVERLRRLKN